MSYPMSKINKEGLFLNLCPFLHLFVYCRHSWGYYVLHCSIVTMAGGALKREWRHMSLQLTSQSLFWLCGILKSPVWLLPSADQFLIVMVEIPWGFRKFVNISRLRSLLLLAVSNHSVGLTGLWHYWNIIALPLFYFSFSNDHITNAAPPQFYNKYKQIQEKPKADDLVRSVSAISNGLFTFGTFRCLTAIQFSTSEERETLLTSLYYNTPFSWRTARCIIHIKIGLLNLPHSSSFPSFLATH